MASSIAPVITIDGPGGAGKGTVARLLAEQLGWHLLDSGALYRLTALAVTQQQTSLDDSQAIAAIAKSLDVVFQAGKETVTIFLAGNDVTSAIRQESTAVIASQVAAMPEVRQALLQRQYSFRQSPGLIADGRDMGTVVFVDAPLKIFLTASSDERARRRFEQLKAMGESVNLAALKAEIDERDARDANRVIAPLKPAEDAVIIDSTFLSIQQVLLHIMEQVKSRNIGT